MQSAVFRLGALSALLYLFLALFYHTSALVDIAWLQQVVLFGGLSALLWAYVRAEKAAREEAVSPKLLFAVTVLIALLAVTIPPFDSTDVFGYINRGWQQTGYAVNPYVHPVADIAGWEQDPMFTGHWHKNPSPYGFMFMHITRWLTMLSGGSKLVALMLFKAFNLLVYLATAGVIWFASQRLGLPQPGRAWVLFAWNPLILLHFLANAHNDIVMGFLHLLGLVLVGLGGWLWVLPTFLLPAMVKYATLILLPFTLLLLMKNRQWFALSVGVTLSVVILAACAFNYLQDWHLFKLDRIQENALISRGSLHAFFINAYDELEPLINRVDLPGGLVFPTPDVVGKILKNVLLGTFGLFYGALGLHRLRSAQYTAAQWQADMLLLLLVLIAVVSLKFYPWYLGMFFPMALLLPEGHPLRRFTLLLSVFQLYAFTFLGQAHFLDFLMTLIPLILVCKCTLQGRTLPILETPPASRVQAEFERVADNIRRSA